MQRSIRFLLFFSLVVIVVVSCTTEEPGDSASPILISASPADESADVAISTTISLKFNENIKLTSNPQIKLNNNVVNAIVSGQILTIQAVLETGKDYTLNIPYYTVFDLSGNSAEEINIHFYTAQNISVDGDVYEAEKAVITGDAVVANAIKAYSGSGYVNTNTGNVNFTVSVDQSGYYDIYFRYISASQKINTLYVDGNSVVDVIFGTNSQWSEIKAATLKLTAGTHTISLVKSWGYIQLDYLRMLSSSNVPTPFSIAPVPVTPNPSAQAVNLYNFLKTSFGSKILSGTMANYSTNINEATWVHNNTGKWPALTCFDFINHTWANQSWVEYSAPFTLGQEWWNNNGVVALMWHWRDPLTKSGGFYTYSSTYPDGTTFDVSKVSDASSAEYKAVIADIDVTAGYLKQFKDAGIPVIWRPLHEAEGGWFWWGAKGAEPCKYLWKLLFDRLVNYHGLNNLIWVWTTSASDNATTWYPGDNYVDILGMDIYPGANQHGSQYISFNKVREITAGKKMITLSECGSVPDPALMMDYGDTWSWFMPWNGDYTESSSHNGATWWNKFFSYDYVITRDKMPSLK